MGVIRINDLLIVFFMNSRIMVWNYQGARHPNFHRFINEFLRENDLEIMVLIETRISGYKVDRVIKQIRMPFLHKVEVVRFSRGIWLL
ncbi:hypothetical protein E1A91_A09G140500v1 [Gossypium mustelinum]|uniref:Endonuclease/exonuclease/phosphatase domain-containing protein n=1 Tax=Gossypium mustelinum TaxID=34275 RepID=A0A5D2XXY1_GOSMU|nr:hypothetical protein E1A91_A09G140500v1 [Gossypium mustelinum]